MANYVPKESLLEHVYWMILPLYRVSTNTLIKGKDYGTDY